MVDFTFVILILICVSTKKWKNMIINHVSIAFPGHDAEKQLIVYRAKWHITIHNLFRSTNLWYIWKWEFAVWVFTVCIDKCSKKVVTLLLECQICLLVRRFHKQNKFNKPSHSHLWVQIINNEFSYNDAIHL